MNNEILRSVQLVQLQILKTVKKICKENDIPYFLVDGTLLGAVRHKGFIPWDDDLDIAMLRPDYDRFLRIAEASLPEEYFLQTWFTDQEYGMPYAKILKNGTVYVEGVSKNSRSRNGIFIDVFPLDSCGEKSEMVKFERKYVFYNKLLQMKCHYENWNATGSIHKRWKYVPFILASHCYSRKALINKLSKMIHENNLKYQEAQYCYESWGSGFINYIFRKDYLKEQVEIQFEDDVFSCPADYDLLLKDEYGNYMQLPPADQRENRHNIVEVQF